jgi:hypothetical protein
MASSVFTYQYQPISLEGGTRCEGQTLQYDITSPLSSLEAKTLTMQYTK